MSAEECTYIAKVLHNTLYKAHARKHGLRVGHLVHKLLQVRRRHGVATAGRRTLRGVAHGRRLLQEAVVRQQRALVELRQRHKARAAALACAACQGTPDSDSSADTENSSVHTVSVLQRIWQAAPSTDGKALRCIPRPANPGSLS